MVLIRDVPVGCKVIVTPPVTIMTDAVKTPVEGLEVTLVQGNDVETDLVMSVPMITDDGMTGIDNVPVIEAVVELCVGHGGKIGVEVEDAVSEVTVSVDDMADPVAQIEVVELETGQGGKLTEVCFERDILFEVDGSPERLVAVQVALALAVHVELGSCGVVGMVTGTLISEKVQELFHADVVTTVLAVGGFEGSAVDVILNVEFRGAVRLVLLSVAVAGG